MRVIGKARANDPLTDLETRVLQAVADYGRLPAAAKSLNYSLGYLLDVARTARYKLGVRTTLEAVVRGLREGWLR